MIVDLIEALYRLLWGDLFTLPVAGGIGISFMVVLLFAAGIGFTLRTRLLPVRLFRDMIGAVCEKKQAAGGLSSFQTLVISTATRVGMGNLVGVVAAVSAGGAGAVFWMWVTALLGASTSFVESTLAQKYRVPDPLYGGWRGGPAYYLHVLAERKRGKKLKRSVCAALFAVSGLICWCGISQVISNSVSSAFENAFHVPPLATTVVLTLLAALIVLRKNATVKSLDFIVPVMAVCYFVITVGIVVLNLRQLPAVLARIFAEAFGLRVYKARFAQRTVGESQRIAVGVLYKIEASRNGINRFAVRNVRNDVDISVSSFKQKREVRTVNREQLDIGVVVSRQTVNILFAVKGESFFGQVHFDEVVDGKQIIRNAAVQRSRSKTGKHGLDAGIAVINQKIILSLFARRVGVNRVYGKLGSSDGLKFEFAALAVL